MNPKREIVWENTNARMVSILGRSSWHYPADCGAGGER